MKPFQEGRRIHVLDTDGTHLGYLTTAWTGVIAFLPDGRWLGAHDSWRAALDELVKRR